MTATTEKTKLDEFYRQFLKDFDQKSAEAVWEKQSEIFRQFWKDKILGQGKLDRKTMDSVICFLDRHAKGIAESEAEPACNPMIPQGAWHRIFETLKKNKKLSELVTKIFESDIDDEQIELLNQLYSVNTEKNRLTGKTATMLNDLMFVYRPSRNLTIVSLKHRFMIMDAFGLGDENSIQRKSWGEQIVFSKNAVLKFREKYPFENPRALSCFFYSSGVRELWGDRQVSESAEDMEFDEHLEDEGFFEIPVADRKIVTEASDPPIKTLCEKIDKGRITVRADFQRYYIWDTKPKLKSRLIESVLLRVPIPVIYTAEEADGRELVVDGQQRLLTFYGFTKKDGFRLSGLRVLKELNGKSYRDLDESLQDAIDDYPIRVIKIRKESHKDIKFDIFERLNRGSVKLNEQELRNCIYRGSFNDLLKKLALNKDFQRLQGLKDVHPRMLDLERILRFFAFSDITERKYKGPLTSFLNSYMEAHRQMSDKLQEEKAALFKKSLELCQTVFGKYSFRRWYAGDDDDPNGQGEDKINEGIFDIQMYGFTQYEKRQLIGRAEVIKEKLFELMTGDVAFIESIERGTYDTNKVKLRTEKWFQSLREVVGYPENDRRLYTFEEKQALFDKDHICHICRNEIAFIEDAHVDHFERYAEGGKTSIKNGKLSHRYCNLSKG